MHLLRPNVPACLRPVSGARVANASPAADSQGPSSAPCWAAPCDDDSDSFSQRGRSIRVDSKSRGLLFGQKQPAKVLLNFGDN